MERASQYAEAEKAVLEAKRKRNEKRKMRRKKALKGGEAAGAGEGAQESGVEEGEGEVAMENEGVEAIEEALSALAVDEMD